MKWFVVENTWLSRDITIMGFGWGNGYVLIPSGHPFHGLPYDDIDVWVHGGLTYGGSVTEQTVEHYLELVQEDIGTWMVGFDTAHYDDTLAKWPKEAVEEETKRLRKQIVTLGDKFKLIT